MRILLFIRFPYSFGIHLPCLTRILLFIRFVYSFGISASHNGELNNRIAAGLRVYDDGGGGGDGIDLRPLGGTDRSRCGPDRPLTSRGNIYRPRR